MNLSTGQKVGLGLGLGVVLLSSFKKASDRMSFKFLLPFILKWECKWKVADNPPYGFIIVDGRYTNHPNDKGGETKWGIAKKYYPNEDIPNMTLERATQIYLSDYWKRYRCERVPQHLRYMFFDTSVNQGGNFATKTLQRLGGVTQDGILGKITEAAAKNVTVEAFAQARRDQYNKRIKEDPTQEVFKRGWLNRVADVEATQKRLNQV